MKTQYFKTRKVSERWTEFVPVIKKDVLFEADATDSFNEGLSIDSVGWEVGLYTQYENKVIMTFMEAMTDDFVIKKFTDK